METIYFWNAEHLSSNAEGKIDKEEAKLEALKKEETYRYNRHMSFEPYPHRPPRVMRSHLKGGGPIRRIHNREYHKAYKSAKYIEEQTINITRRKNKFKNELWLTKGLSNKQHSFICEVQEDYLGSISSLRGVADPATLCYYYGGGGLASALNWRNVPDPVGLTGQNSRIPKTTQIANVEFCFWHAPSGNNGQVVANTYNWLLQAGNNFVLFGDLNAEPDQVKRHGVPAANILEPDGPTRISGRKIDYAITNVPDRFLEKKSKRLFDVEGMEIKNETGSDHMIMKLQMKN